MKTFENLGLSPELLGATKNLGFETATPIQEKVIPIILENEKDVVALAQTGTGKTAAFGLPLIQKIDPKNKYIQVLVLAPTRELCVQITQDLQNFSQGMKFLKVVAVYGGANIETQIRNLRDNTQMVVATPGRMIDLMKRKKVDISHINTLVLDEADEMLNMGFREELNRILSETPPERNTLLFSATMEKEVARIANEYMKQPVRVTVGKQNSSAENITHQYYIVSAQNRYQVLKRVADINPKIYGLVFCRTRNETKEVADKLIKDGYNADALHGELSQDKRDHVMKRFRQKTLQILVATDVAARGIDVQDITHVIHYKLPDETETYLHRSGRTGRAQKSGVSIALSTARDHRKIKQIEKTIGKKLEAQKIPTGQEICQKQLFNFVDTVEKVKVEEDQMTGWMSEVLSQLNAFSKEEVIQRFVALEFERLLGYYRNAPDLNKRERIGQDESKRDGRKRDKRQKRNQAPEPGFSRFFINIGNIDRINVAQMIGMFSDVLKSRDFQVGRVEMKDRFSFFEIEEAYEVDLLKKFKNVTHNNRAVRIEKAVAGKSSGTKKHNSREKKYGKERYKNRGRKSR